MIKNVFKEKKNVFKGLPWSPVVKAQCFPCRGHGFLI